MERAIPRTALVVRREDDLARAERGRVLHPVVRGEVRRVEEHGVEARVVGARLIGVVDGCRLAIVVRRVVRVEVVDGRIPERRQRKMEELRELEVHEVELPRVGQRHGGGERECECEEDEVRHRGNAAARV